LPIPPKVSKDDVQRLRLYELSRDEPAEDVRVRFRTKRGQPDLPHEFVKAMRDTEGHGTEWEREFLRSKPHQKLRQIVAASDLKYADQIEIFDDPKAFSAFRRKVLPLVTGGCTASGCHGGNTAKVFRLPRGSTQDEEYVYACFLILDSLTTRHGPLIDRDLPESSVLLSYMLPPDGNPRAHPPPARGKVRPVLRGEKDPDHQLVVDWIGSLRTPHPRYELDYKLPAWATSQPASAPAGAKEEKAPPSETGKRTPGGKEP
jgi:hypothetical protein